MENKFYTQKSTNVIHRSVFVTIFILLSLIVTKTNAQNVSVQGTTVVGTAVPYLTLKAAFDAINLGAHQGVITVNIIGNTVEGASASLNPNGGAVVYSAVNIQPSGGAARSISGSGAFHLINLNGADNVTINGLNTGGNSLTITNSNNTGAFSAIRLINDASSNTITNCNLQGSGTGTSGVVWLSTGTTTGNDNNTISNSNIGPAGANLPSRGILSVGTSAAVNNSGGLITGNNIFDYFSATAGSDGINLGAGNNLWTVSNNRLYQTGNRIYTTAGLLPTGITVGSGDGNVVSGNIVGFANSSGTGTTNMLGISSGAITGTFPSAYTIGTAVGNTLTYRGINCVGSVGGALTKVFNNRVAGFAMLSGSGAVSFNPATLAAQRGVFCGISISTGVFDCGGDGANIIGSTSGTGSIYLANTVVGQGGGAIVGIFFFLSAGSSYQVLNNQMGGWDATGTNLAGTISGSITGIQTGLNRADFNIKNNTIGNTTNPNMRIGTFIEGGLLSNNSTATFGTSTGAGTFHGIWNSSTLGAGTFVHNIGEVGKSNIIQNASVNSTSISANYKGIECSRYNLSNQASPIDAVVEYNIIRFLTSNSGSSTRTGLPTAFESNFGGIGVYVAGGSSTIISNITGNEISDLSVTNTTTGGNIAGIVVQIPFNNAIQIDKNKICRLSNASTTTSATVPGTVSGIFLGDLNANTGIVTNNMISLGNSQTTNTSFIGIWAGEAVATLSLLQVYHNTVHIDGVASSGAQSTFNFYRGDFSGTTLATYSVDVLNNIFVNTRTGGTGRHFAIGDNFNATASTAGWGVNASDYNILNANPSTVGYWNGDRTFSAWVTASASDAHSFSGVAVTFVGPCDLHLNMGVTPNFIESQGNLLAAVPTDIDGHVRPGPAGSVNGGALAGQADLGADEFDGVPILAPTITMISPATASVCGLVSHLVKADITPNTGTLTTVILFWNNGTPGSVAMTNTSGIRYEATIPAASTLKTVTWRIEATNTGGVTKTFYGTPYTDPIPPASPTTTNYSVCNGVVPSGEGLTATCLTGGTNNISFNITQPTIDETATGTQGVTSVCPGNTVIGSFTIPALATGATITYAGVTINGVKLRTLGNSTSYGSEMELSFSGSGIIGGGPTDCVSGATSESTPIFINYVTGSGLNGSVDVTNLIASLNPAGGTITVTYNESYNDIPLGPDVELPSTGTFTIITTLPATTINWYNTPSGPIGSGIEGSGSPLDPLTQAGLPNVTGVYPYYARCIAGACQSTVGTTATFYINQPLSVTATKTLNGNVCDGIENQLGTTAVGGGQPYTYSWAPTAGLDDPNIANPIATPSSTTNYTVTVTDACSNVSRSVINLPIIPSPVMSVSPKNTKICRATDGPVQIIASGADFYAWSPATGLDVTTGSTVFAYPLSNTSYVVLGTLANGCTGSDVANVSSDDKPLITAIATPPALCTSPNSTQLSVSTNPVYCVIPQEGQSGGFINITFNTLNSFPTFPAIQQFNSHAPVGNETTTISAGSTYSLFASTVTGVANITSVWIDFNHDGDYAIDEWRQISIGPSSASVSIAVPLSAVNGLTGMRLRQRNFANDVYSACIPWQAGSTEEYTIRIINGVNQPALQTYSWAPTTYLNNPTSGTPVATNVLANTTYTVTVSNFVGCTNSATVFVSASPLSVSSSAVQTQIYCTNTNNSNGGTVYISNVTLGSGTPLINNTTTTSGQQFGIYTAPNPTLSAGTTYPISVSTRGVLGVAIWVDYNQNGAFDFFELQYSSFANNLNETYSGSVVVPSTAFNGQTRMRIRALQDFDPTDAGASLQEAACAAFVHVGNTFDNGETEDYFLVISGGITKVNPCGGAKFQLNATVSGGGSPYTYLWSPASAVTLPSFSAPVTNGTILTSTNFTVTVTDKCGNVQKSIVPVILSPPPVVLVEYDNIHGGICDGTGNVTIIASGADFYTWSPATGLDNTDQDAVLASPTQTTFYVVTGNQGGCTSTTSAAVVVFDPLVFEATADATFGCDPFSTQLHSGIPSASLVFSEVTLNRNGAGATVPYPAYIGGPGAIDFVEISNVSNDPIDISGYQLDDYITTSVISNHPYTFLPGTIIPAKRALVLHIGDAVGGGSTDNPANNYYNTGGAADFYITTSQVGFVLRNGATIVDVVGCGAGYVFDPGTGVTAADWAGSAPTAAGLAGVVRNIITDNNDGGDWFASNIIQQNIGTYSPGMINITSYSWTPSTGLSSATVGDPFITNLTSNTTYTVTAINSYGCVGTSSITIFVNPTPTAPTITPGSTTTFCSGGSVSLTASSANGSPTYTWAPADGLSSTIGTVVTASPTATTIYTLTVTIPGGCTATTTLTVTINTANTPNITYSGNPSFCTPGSKLLNASAPGPYTNWSWTAGGPVLGTSSTYLATAGGTYVVTVTAPNTCTTTASVVITANPPPAAPVATLIGTIPICDNASASVVIDIPTVAGLTYQWNDGGATTTEDITIYGDNIDILGSGIGSFDFNVTVTDANGCTATSNNVTVTTMPCGILFNMRMYMQGYYDENTGFMDGDNLNYPNSGTLNILFQNGLSLNSDPEDVDTIDISLMDEFAYTVVETQRGILKRNGDISVTFSGPAVSGTNYWIQLKHRNMLETWSSTAITFTSLTTYDFTTASTQAFDEGVFPMFEVVPGVWACFNGDIDHSGDITSLDMTQVENDFTNYPFGYSPSDLDGDIGATSLDMTIIENNIILGVFLQDPIP